MKLDSATMSKPDTLLLYSLWIIIASFALTVISATSEHYCEISDPETRTKYDLRKLIPSHKDITVKTDYEGNEFFTIRMQICSPLVNKCNYEDGYGLCMKYFNNTEKGIGKFPPRISNKNGRTLIKFEGTVCSAPIKYRIVVSLKCDYLAGNDTYPIIINFHPDSCNIFIEWKTSLICPTRTHIDCTTAHNNEHYDLTLLTKYSRNYRVRTKSVSSKMVLNVCHSVIRESGVNCAPEAGACLIDEKRKTYLNLGNVQEHPFFANGHIWLEYQNGDLCDIANTTSHISRRYKTTIIFICSSLVKETVPEYARIIEECHYEIIWYTSVACSIRSLLSNDSYVSSNCTVLNPITKFVYNLRPLMNRDYDLKNNQEKYKISICTPLRYKDGGCFEESGACHISLHSTAEGDTDSTWGSSGPIGKANANLLWALGGPYLHYHDGYECDSKVYFSTIIKFICSQNPSNFGPIVVEEDDCYLIIHFYTNLICEKQIECITNDTDEIDLTPLMRPLKNYVVKDEHTNVEYYINICRTLVSTPGLNCEHGSAACSAELDLDKQYQNEVSLGHLEDSPELNKDLQVVLRYVNGGPCWDNHYRHLSTNITFVCSNNDQEIPVYKNYVDCTYLFEWNTRLACGTMIGTWQSPCILEEKVFAHIYDLSVLYAKQQIYYVKGRQGKEYSINICNREQFCDASAVCREDHNYGSLHGVFFNYKRKDIRLEYLNGDDCKECEHCENNGYSAEITFICNESVGMGEPRIRMESKCTVEFEWETELICMLDLDFPNITNINEHPSTERPQEVIPVEESFSDQVTNLIISFVALIFASVAVLVVLYYWRRRVLFHNRLRTCLQACFSYFYSIRYNEGPVTFRAARLNEDTYETSFSISESTVYAADDDDNPFSV